MNLKIFYKIILIFVIFVLFEAYHFMRTKFNSNDPHSLNPDIVFYPSLKFNKSSKFQYLKPACQCSNNRNEYIMIEESEDRNLVVSYIKTPISPTEIYQRKKITLQTTMSELDLETISCDLYNVLKRGKNQKVISYSLYGTNFIYYQSIERILSLMRIKYPGYIARIHYDDSINQTSRCILECKYSDVVDFCNMNHFSSSIRAHIDSNELFFKNLNYMHKMMWRFLAIGDTFVDVFMSRDTDSIFIDREIDSVAEWMGSNSFGHIMRDHPQHGVPILGGMWGARNSLNRELSKKIFELVRSEDKARQYNSDGKTPKGSDQNFLADHVYPYIGGISTIHDSYSCKSFAGSKPFPTQRKVVDHIGSVTYENTTKIDKCPLECRPPDHQDWEYC